MVTTTSTFETLARASDDTIDVLRGAALIAKDVYDDLDVERLVEQVDALAGPLSGGALVGLPLVKQAEEVTARFRDLGFRGNVDDYYDVKNSLLNDVLERRTGIPITLTLLWCHIAKRAGVFARGVSFPGHFLARVDPLLSLSGRVAADSSGSLTPPVIVDPFASGRIVSDDDARALLRRALGEGAELDDSLFVPANPRAVLVRMLTNLKSVWAKNGEHTRAFVAVDRILSLVPDSARMLRERAGVALKIGLVDLARTDLKRVLELEPEAPDAKAIEKHLQKLGTSPRSAPN
jgi:regulator of sirC expression with transglutaminase-like and TPR domain